MFVAPGNPIAVKMLAPSIPVAPNLNPSLMFLNSIPPKVFLTRAAITTPFASFPGATNSTSKLSAPVSFAAVIPIFKLFVKRLITLFLFSKIDT